MRSGECSEAQLLPFQQEASELRNIMSSSVITARQYLK